MSGPAPQAGSPPSVSCALAFERFQAKDLSAVMAIELEAYPEPWTENMFRQELGNASSEFFVVFFEGVLVGYGGFWRVAGEAHITSVTIACDYRGRGFGRGLVEYLLRIAGDLGLTEATLEVRESNLRAYNLYKNMGFEVIGRRKGYYRKTNEDALVMARAIARSDPKNSEARSQESGVRSQNENVL